MTSSAKKDLITPMNEDPPGNRLHHKLANPHIRHLDATSFERTIQHGIVLVDFDEPGCELCRKQLAVLEDLANQMESNTTLAEVNIDTTPELALKYEVEGIPTLLLFKDGQPIGRFVGLQREPRLTIAIRTALSR